jgi:non-specific serine/threonine protein kinase/serine/threonine-protein kinase
MTPERWDKINCIYHGAVEIDAGRRPAFLIEACDGDDALLQDLKSLLASHELADTFIEQPVFAGIEWTEEENGTYAIERRIGSYEITCLIDTGGMGSVYLALRADDQYRKQVAIKVIKRGMDTDFILRRFRHERQILANLNHPNIAQLLDGGATEDGLPYYVMEYVQGESIDVYCDSHKLSITERLKLFLTVCSAVHYAHQNLVVHLDIKPSNILVTEEGTPKLLDFGIAKLLDTGAYQQTLLTTGLSPRLVTPSYGSPEQFRGEAITTASDIYSLGVLLYELLCGHPPYQLKDRRLEEISRVICEEQPRKPSTMAVLVEETPSVDEDEVSDISSPENVSKLRHTTPEKLQRNLAGDLDNIVLKAMQKEPQRRYRSVEQLSEDVQRYLDGRPVTAQPDTLIYRTRKFVARHKTSVLAGFLVFASLFAGTIGVAWQAHVARGQRARAERRFNDVRALANSLLFDLHDSIKDLPGSTPARKLLVDCALQYLDSLSREAGGDRALQVELAQAYEKVGDVQGNPYYANLGNTAGAIESYGKARAILESLLKDDPNNASLKWGLGSNNTALGWCSETKQDFPSALRYLRQALVIFESIVPQDAKASDRVAGSHYGIANILAETGDASGALESYRKAAAIRLASLPSANPAQSALLRTHLAADYTGIARVYAGQGQFDSAIEAQQKSTALIEELYATDHTNATLQGFLADSYQFVGSDLIGKGSLQKGMQNLRRARQIYQSLSEVDPSNALVRYRIGYTDLAVGDGLLKQKQYTEGMRSFREALIIFQQLTENNPANNDDRRGVADAYSNIGTAYEALAKTNRLSPSGRLQDWQTARTNYEKSIEILNNLKYRSAPLQQDNPEATKLRQNIASCDKAIARLRGV